MYPSEYYSMYPPFPRLDQVFVAMSFSDVFTNRWKNVIEPAVSRISIRDKKLRASRVDMNTISDSILTEILTGVSRSRLVFADITTIGTVSGKAVRNENVLYEIGLAQAVRLPEEVILFRSDNDPISFDVSNIRVNWYDPDQDPEKAKDLVCDAILSSLNEVDLKRHLTVERFSASLDYDSWWTLCLAQQEEGIAPTNSRSISGIVGSFSHSRSILRLLEIGALKTEYKKLSPEAIDKCAEKDDPGLLMRYECTELGVALFNYAMDKLEFFDPEMIKYLEGRRRKEVTGSAMESRK